MESAVERFQRILDENNLAINLQDPQLRGINGGGIIIEKALLQITFKDPKKEVVDEPAEPSPKEVAQETQNES